MKRSVFGEDGKVTYGGYQGMACLCARRGNRIHVHLECRLLGIVTNGALLEYSMGSAKVLQPNYQERGF